VAQLKRLWDRAAQVWIYQLFDPKHLTYLKLIKTLKYFPSTSPTLIHLNGAWIVTLYNHGAPLATQDTLNY
jgi:hypothetical protein